MVPQGNWSAHVHYVTPQCMVSYNHVMSFKQNAQFFSVQFSCSREFVSWIPSSRAPQHTLQHPLHCRSNYVAARNLCKASAVAIGCFVVLVSKGDAIDKIVGKRPSSIFALQNVIQHTRYSDVAIWSFANALADLIDLIIYAWWQWPFLWLIHISPHRIFIRSQWPYCTHKIKATSIYIKASCPYYRGA